jgi:hypothetical protein
MVSRSGLRWLSPGSRITRGYPGSPCGLMLVPSDTALASLKRDELLEALDALSGLG